MKIKLVYGNFFFAGEVSITGNGTTIDINDDLITSDLIKVLRVSKESGIIDFEEIVKVDAPSNEETVEEPLNIVSTNKKIKRG